MPGSIQTSLCITIVISYVEMALKWKPGVKERFYPATLYKCLKSILSHDFDRMSLFFISWPSDLFLSWLVCGGVGFKEGPMLRDTGHLEDFQRKSTEKLHSQCWLLNTALTLTVERKQPHFNMWPKTCYKIDSLDWKIRFYVLLSTHISNTPLHLLQKSIVGLKYLSYHMFTIA